MVYNKNIATHSFDHLKHVQRWTTGGTTVCSSSRGETYCQGPLAKL